MPAARGTLDLPSDEGASEDSPLPAIAWRLEGVSFQYASARHPLIQDRSLENSTVRQIGGAAVLIADRDE